MWNQHTIERENETKKRAASKDSSFSTCSHALVHQGMIGAALRLNLRGREDLSVVFLGQKTDLGLPVCAFVILSSQSHILGSRKLIHPPRLNPVFAVPPSAILLRTDESGNFQESRKSSGLNSSSFNSHSSGSLLNQANAVGIIGGGSVNSTLNFMGKLVELSSKDGESLPFVLASDPALNNELQAQKRISKLDSRSIVENLRHKRAFLEKSGARCIVMPCHFLHSWYDEVSEGSSANFLHIGDCVAKELKEYKLKPLEAGSPLRIGVLAPHRVLMSGFYQEKLQNEGFEVVVPDKATMEHTVIPAMEAMERKDIEGARNLLRIALQVLLVRAVNSVVFASDDMRNLLPPDDPLLKKCIDPMDALARSIIKWAKSSE